MKKTSKKKKSKISYYKLFMGGNYNSNKDWRERIIKDFKSDRKSIGTKLVILDRFKCLGMYPDQSFNELLLSIKKSDVVFFYIDEMEKNKETISKLVLKSHSCDKPTILIFKNEQVLESYNDIYAFGNEIYCLENIKNNNYIKEIKDNIKNIYRIIYNYLQWNGFYADSEPERRFWNKIKRKITNIYMQYNVKIKKSSYSLDFAIPKSKIGIEIDGFRFHDRTQKSFTDERRRLRELQSEGWYIIKFSALEINTKIQYCIDFILNEIKKKNDV